MRLSDGSAASHGRACCTPRISAPPRTKTPTSDDRLFGDGVRPRALVEPRKLVERRPHFPVVGVQRLHRPGPGEYNQRRVRPERAGFGYIMRELVAETLDIERIEKLIPQLICTITGNSEDAGKRP